MEPAKISIKGAREHNLKNISLEIPKKKFIVFTGVSGSGKSSLAFDILYAEGQRRYVESLSSYARQFLGQMPKPHFEYIRGLSPAISIEQKAASKNPRSTVGTVTEIYDYLRLLFANVGHQHCPHCLKPVSRQSATEIVHMIYKEFKGSVRLFAPLVQNRKGEFRDVFEALRADGFSKIRVDGNMISLEGGVPSLNKKQKHYLDLLIDQVTLSPSEKTRVHDSVESGLKYGQELIRVESEDGKKVYDFSQKFACVSCGISFRELNPQSFSFNSPIGMCEECNGLGYKMEADPELVIPNKELTLRQGAVIALGDSFSLGEGWEGSILQGLLSQFNINADIPWRDLPEEHKHIILHGIGSRKINVAYVSRRKSSNEWQFHSSYTGVLNRLQKKYHETQSEQAREWYSQFMREMECSVCKGKRLKEAYCHVYVADKNIIDVCRSSIGETLHFFEQLKLNDTQQIIAEEIVKEIKSRLKFLCNLGLDYLTLDRKAPTLSGGESQRIRLASQIGSELSGVMYILDEPSIGLHQRDNQKLLDSLIHLKNLGNTVIVIEHDEDTIRAADHIVDFGPGAGVKGGEIVVSGSLSKVISSSKSLTGAYLCGKKSIPVPSERRKGTGTHITIFGAKENNLKVSSLDIPLNKFVCITGVSGAGKSTLINNILVPAVSRILNHSKDIPGKYDKIVGLEHINKIINIDQQPIGRTSRSNPATYTKVYDYIREFFAQLPESKLRGYESGRFSFNVKGGRCEACQGAGTILVEMHFLPDVYVECEVCKGKRFNENTLEVLYKGKSIADVLGLSVVEAFELFKEFPRIRKILQTLMDVGMDYMHLGQSSTTLSGGEAQRIKLSRELSKSATGKTLYVLDEPTTGLHFDDISKLLSVLNIIVDNGNTVVVIEHNLDVIKTSDYVIDLGPEGGVKGGRIVAEGTPEEVMKNSKSYTGHFLKHVLGKGK